MSELRIEDAAVRWAVDGRPAEAEQAVAALAARPLLLLMHGYGSFEGDLIELAPLLPHGFVCASPRAPLVAPPPIVDGYAWWQLPVDANGLPLPAAPHESFVGGDAHAAALALLAWIDELDARLGRPGTIALMGFSQGGAMVTSLLRLRPERFSCGVNCSGFVASGGFAGDAALAEIRPPLFWGRDTADPVIDAGRIERMREWAPVHTALEARLYTGIQHGIGRDELEDVSGFLERHVPGAAR